MHEENPTRQSPVTPRSASADYVASRWSALPPHVRETLITIVDAALLVRERELERGRTAIEGRPR